jgi:hypothetical protein
MHSSSTRVLLAPPKAPARTGVWPNLPELRKKCIMHITLIMHIIMHIIMHHIHIPLSK